MFEPVKILEPEIDKKSSRVKNSTKKKKILKSENHENFVENSTWKNPKINSKKFLQLKIRSKKIPEARKPQNPGKIPP